jgi:hypothetical protein
MKNIQDGLSRSRENAILREKMASVDENMLQPQNRVKEKQQSLGDKLRDELE